MVLCAPGSDGCPMTSVPSCCPNCSSGTLSWPPRRRRSHLRCWSWKTIRNSPTRSRPSCGRYARAGRCPSIRGGDESWMSSSRTSMTSPGERSRRSASGRGCRDRRAARIGTMPRGHRRGHAACPDGPARAGRRPCTHRVRDGEATHLSLPSLADECPEWEWYEESWNPHRRATCALACSSSQFRSHSRSCGGYATGRPRFWARQTNRDGRR